VKARLQGIESSRSALAATQTGYEVGTRNIVDVLLAQQRLFLSEFQFASARYQYIKNTLRLKQLVGSLDQQDLVELNRFIDVSKSVTQVKPLEQ
jgi:outer membrane protein